MLYEGLYLWSSTVIRTSGSFYLVFLLLLLLLGVLTAMVKERRKEGQMYARERDLLEEVKSSCLCGRSRKTRAESRACTLEL